MNKLQMPSAVKSAATILNKPNANNARLIKHYNEIKAWENNESFIYIVAGGVIQRWMQNNKSKLNELFEKIRVLHAEYFQLNEAGKILKSEDGKQLLLEGKSLDEYTGKFRDLMNEPVFIKY